MEKSSDKCSTCEQVVCQCIVPGEFSGQSTTEVAYGAPPSNQPTPPTRVLADTKQKSRVQESVEINMPGNNLSFELSVPSVQKPQLPTSKSLQSNSDAKLKKAPIQQDEQPQTASYFMKLLDSPPLLWTVDAGVPLYDTTVLDFNRNPGFARSTQREFLSKHVVCQREAGQQNINRMFLNLVQANTEKSGIFFKLRFQEDVTNEYLEQRLPGYEEHPQPGDPKFQEPYSWAGEDDKLVFWRVVVSVFFLKDKQPKVTRATRIRRYPYLAQVIEKFWSAEMREQIPGLNPSLQRTTPVDGRGTLDLSSMLQSIVYNRRIATKKSEDATKKSEDGDSERKAKRQRVDGPDSSLPLSVSSSSSSSSSSGLSPSPLSSTSAHHPGLSSPSETKYPSLQCTLTPRQEENVRWMLKNENTPFYRHFWCSLEAQDALPFQYNPFTTQFATVQTTMSEQSGGILADGVGLGKTPQILALIVRSKRTLPSLIIVPTSLIGQWKAEIQKHTDGLRVECYYGLRKQSLTSTDLQGVDVVVTTYTSLVKPQRTPAYADFLRVQKQVKNQNPKEESYNLDRVAELVEEAAFPGPKYTHLLEEVQWQRIILDEGHLLANPNTSKYRRIFELKARSRWILSATPFRSWDAYFSLMRLLHFPMYHLMSAPFKAFKKCLQDSFRAHLIRPVLEQALASTICGNSAASSSVQRGPIAFQNHVVPFETSDQEELYELMRKEVANRFHGLQISGSLASRPMQAFAILRSLRRVAAGCGASFSRREAEQMIESQGKWFRLSGQRQERKYRQASHKPYQDIDTVPCPICLETFENPLQTKCHHLFCEDCIVTYLMKGASTCPHCRETLKIDEDEEKYTRDLYLPNLPRPAVTSSSSGVGKKPSGKAEAGSGDRVVMSAKMNALVKLLVHLQQEEPKAKSIVFSQFSESIDNISHRLSSMGIKHATIRGSYSHSKRSETGQMLQDFKEEPKMTVFLLSQRTGSVGINLTVANHVFLMEPTMNPAVEVQAIGRVYRMTQTKPVTVHYMTMRGTLEEKLQARNEGENRMLMDSWRSGQNESVFSSSSSSSSSSSTSSTSSTSSSSPSSLPSKAAEINGTFLQYLVQPSDK